MKIRIIEDFSLENGCFMLNQIRVIDNIEFYYYEDLYKDYLLENEKYFNKLKKSDFKDLISFNKNGIINVTID